MTEPKAGASRRRQQLWVYLVGTLFVADFVFYGYLPSQRRLKSLREARANQHRLITMAASQTEELPVLKERLQTAREIVSHFEEYVPAKQASGPFLKDIAHLMTEHGLSDQVVAPGKETEADGIRCIPVSMDCTGSLKNIFGFFRDVREMDRLVRIEKVVLENDSELLGPVSLHTEALIFYRPSGGHAGEAPGHKAPRRVARDGT
jgi:Tfp pilus assembly protein PilO